MMRPGINNTYTPAVSYKSRSRPSVTPEEGAKEKGGTASDIFTLQMYITLKPFVFCSFRAMGCVNELPTLISSRHYRRIRCSTPFDIKRS